MESLKTIEEIEEIFDFFFSIAKMLRDSVFSAYYKYGAASGTHAEEKNSCIEMCLENTICKKILNTLENERLNKILTFH